MEIAISMCYNRRYFTTYSLIHGKHGDNITMQQFYRRKIFEHIQTFRKGNVTWRDQQDCISIQNDSGTTAEIHINDHRAYKLMAKRGSIGLGESYAKGYWTTSQFTTTADQSFA